MSDLIANREKLETVRQKLNATLRPYATRDDFEAALIPDGVTMVYVISEGLLYQLVRDTAGTWISGDGSKWFATVSASIVAGQLEGYVASAAASATSAGNSAAIATMYADGMVGSSVYSITGVAGTSNPFTLPVTPASDAAVDVYFDGVEQPRASYTRSGAVLTPLLPWPTGVLIYAKVSTRLGEVSTSSALSFSSRAAFVTWDATHTPTIGAVADAGGYSYRYIGTGTAIADLPGWVPYWDIYPDHWGENTTPGTTDMTAEIQAAINYLNTSVSAGQGRRPLRFSGGEYLISATINITNDFTRLIGAGSRSTTVSSQSDFGDFFKFAAADPTTTSLFGCGVSGMAFRSFQDTNSGAHLRFTRTLNTRLFDVASDDHFGGILFEGGNDIYGSHIHVFSGRGTLWGGIKSGSYGIRFAEGPATQQKNPATVVLTNVNVRCTDGTGSPYLDTGIDIQCVDGLWLTATHVLGCGGRGGIVAEPQVTALSPSGTQLTGIMASNIWLDNANSYGIRFKGTSNSYGAHVFSGIQGLGAAESHIYVESGCNVVGIEVDGGIVTRSGKNGVRIDDGKSISVRNLKVTSSGNSLVSGSRSAISLAGSASKIEITGCTFTNQILGGTPSSNTQVGVDVQSGAVDFVKVQNCTFDNLTTDISDDYVVGNTATGQKTYTPNVTTRAVSSVATTTNVLQILAHGDYWEADTDTSDLTSFARYFLNRIITVRIGSTRWLRHGGTTTTISLEGGVDYLAKSGDIFRFIYLGARGWVEIGRDVAGKLASTDFNLYDVTDKTKRAAFDASGITTGTTRTYGLPNASGTLALTSGIAQTFANTTTFSATLNFSSNMVGNNTNSRLGYTSSGINTVTQITSKTTGVTINTPAGQITTNAAALGAGATAQFTVTCSACAAVTDVVLPTIQSPTGKYRVAVVGTAAGSFILELLNTTAGSLSEAVIINYAIVKAS